MFKFNQSQNEQQAQIDHVFIDKQNVTQCAIDIDNLICSICHHLLWNPIVCSKAEGCHNSFCKQCINQWKQNCLHNQKSMSCPYCKQIFKGSQPSPLLLTLLKKLLIKCQFRQNGCAQQVKYQNYYQHVKKSCTFRSVKCQGCNQEFIFKNYQQHTNICQQYMVKCEKCATQMTKNNYIKNHEIRSIQQKKTKRTYQCYSNQIQKYATSIQSSQQCLGNISNRLSKLVSLTSLLTSSQPIALQLNFQTRFIANFLFPNPTLIKSSYNPIKSKYDFLHFYITTPIYVNGVFNVMWQVSITRLKGSLLFGFCNTLGLCSRDVIINRFGELKKKQQQQNKYKLVKKQNFQFDEQHIIKFTYLSSHKQIYIQNVTTTQSFSIPSQTLQQLCRIDNAQHNECQKFFLFLSMDTQNDSLKFI